MANLANLLLDIGRFPDAEYWWRLAGEAGNTDAIYNLAVILDKSLHFDDALTWYQRAAEAGHIDAMHNLAIRLRYRGQIAEAATWWRNAGHERAQRTSDKPRGRISPDEVRRRNNMRHLSSRSARTESLTTITVCPSRPGRRTATARSGGPDDRLRSCRPDAQRSGSATHVPA